MDALSTISSIYDMLPKKGKAALRAKLFSHLMGSNGSDGLLDSLLGKADEQVNGISDKDVEERMKPYKKTILQDILYGGASAGADIFKGYKNYQATKESLLGDALLAMSHMTDSPGYSNPLTAAMAPVYAAQKIKGVGHQLTGDTAHKAIHDIADPLREGAERRLSTELLIRENPNAGFYDYNRHRSNIYNRGSGRNY